MGGKNKSHSLLKLGLKKIGIKVWVPTGYGEGYYMYRRVITRDDGSTARLCESQDGTEQWELPVKTLTLSDMGLQRDKYGHIHPKQKKVI